MFIKWKKTLKFLSSIVVLIIYVTVDRYNRETIRVEKSKRFPGGDFSASGYIEDRMIDATVKTIVGYSKEFKIRQELNDRIECARAGSPKNPIGNGKRKSESPEWKIDRTLGVKLYSAYYDKRQGPHRYVRVIGLTPRNITLYCQIWYKGTNNSITHVTQRAIIREIWSKSWGQSDRQCKHDFPSLISCLAPRESGSEILPPPSWVSFVDKNCIGDGGTFLEISSVFADGHDKSSSHSEPIKKINFLICVKPLHFTHINLKTFREWVEINHRLGANKIVAYLSHAAQVNSSALADMENILTVKRFAETSAHPECSTGNFHESIWHRRKMEIIAYNDCFYSKLEESEFVVPLDVDEIIVPKTGNNWREAFRAHFRSFRAKAEVDDDFPWNNYASFSVRNAYFFMDYPATAIFLRETEITNSAKLPKFKKPSGQPKLVTSFSRRRKRSIFDRTLRSYRLSPKSDSVKSFVRVSKTLSVFNHYAFHVLNDETDRRQYIFPENVFQLNHYRNSCDPVLIDGCNEYLNRVIYDNSLEKFRNRKEEP